MPTRNIHKEFPDLGRKRIQLISIMKEIYGCCLHDNCNNRLDIHECTPCSDLQGIKDKSVWELILFHQANIFPICNTTHINNLPDKETIRNTYINRKLNIEILSWYIDSFGVEKSAFYTYPDVAGIYLYFKQIKYFKSTGVIKSNIKLV